MNVQDIISFLSELKNNNNREWFTENKARYDELRIYFEKLGQSLILKIAEFDPDIKNVDVKDCVFRIYRDIRFSNDKTPYKTHFGIFIASRGGRKSQRGGYYLHLDPDGCFIGLGVWCPQPNLLKALRQSVFDNIDELHEILHEKSFSGNFERFFDEDKLKTLPAGFPKDFKDAELLKLKHYIVESKLTNDILAAPDVVDRLAAVFRNGYPLNRFLNYTVDEVI